MKKRGKGGKEKRGERAENKICSSISRVLLGTDSRLVQNQYRGTDSDVHRYRWLKLAAIVLLAAISPREPH